MGYENKIINGRYFAEKILNELREGVIFLKTKNIIPHLAIILVGDDLASDIYVRNKIKASEKIGIEASKILLPKNISQKKLLLKIDELNRDLKISGIIVQLPLPVHIEKDIILSSIDPNKDVDGFHPLNVGLLHIGSSDDGFVPSTPLGIIALLKYYEPNLSGKNVTIIGRSNIVGKPLAALFLRENATVTICHSRTQNLKEITLRSDVIVSAIGIPKILTSDYFSENSIIIDVGINKLEGKEGFVGDVNFEDVIKKVKYISPVPGGVGPMTVAFLMKNTIKACRKSNNI